MKRLLIVSTFSLLIAARMAAELELKGSPGELSGYLSTLPKMVRLIGEGEAEAQADRAIVSLKVSVENKQLQDALRSNEEVRGRVAAFLKDSGIAADRVQAARLFTAHRWPSSIQCRADEPRCYVASLKWDDPPLLRHVTRRAWEPNRHTESDPFRPIGPSLLASHPTPNSRHRAAFPPPCVLI